MIVWKAALRAALKERGWFYLICTIITAIVISVYGAAYYDPARGLRWAVQGGIIMFTTLIGGAAVTHRKEARAREAARVSA